MNKRWEHSHKMPKAFRCRKSREEHKESHYLQGKHREGPSKYEHGAFQPGLLKDGRGSRGSLKSGLL